MKTTKKPAKKSIKKPDDSLEYRVKLLENGLKNIATDIANINHTNWTELFSRRLANIEKSIDFSKCKDPKEDVNWWSPLGFPCEPQKDDIVQCCDDIFSERPTVGYFNIKRDDGKFEITHIISHNIREFVWKKIRPIPIQQTWWMKAGFSVKPSPSDTVLFLSLLKGTHECWNIGKYIGSYDNERGHIVEYLGKRETCSSIKPYTPISTKGQ